MNKRVFASDVEACGFYHQVNKIGDIFCLASEDVDTGEVFLFHDRPDFDGQVVYDVVTEQPFTIPPRTGSLEEGIAFWKDMAEAGHTFAVHNAHGYDRLVLEKIYGLQLPEKAWHDTFVQSKVQWFERPRPKGTKGAHGLEAYGIRFGFPKPPVEDYSIFTPYILYRLLIDCKIQAETYKYLEKERKMCLDRLNIDFTQALNIESKYAYHVAKQEITGALVDIDHIHACIEELDGFLEALEEEITPLLPPTIKGLGKKVSRKEIAEMLGFDSSRIQEVYIRKNIKGESVVVPEKPYVSPSVNYTRTIKSKAYTGFHVSEGYSPEFSKRADFTAWRNENHPDTKPAEWDITVEDAERKVLNKNTCDFFGIEEDSDLIWGAFTRIEITPSTMSQDAVVKKFLVKLGWKYAEEWNLQKDSEGSFIKAEFDTEIRWPEKAAPENQMVKIVKKGEYLVTSPKLSEDEYDQLPEGVGLKIAEYNTYSHRRRFFSNPKDPENKGLLAYIREDGRIPCGVNNFGTRTGRSSHRVFVNVPSVSALYGDNMRKVIVAPEGRVLVGADMKSAQLSIAAYYANNFAYYDNVATGQEFDADGNYVGQTAHCVNSRMFGMVSQQEWEDAVRTQDKKEIARISNIRDASKGGSFATLFGASGKKVATTIGIPESEGTAKRKQFLEEMGLDTTMDVLETYRDDYKRANGWYTPVAFGYWLWNDSPHKSLNTVVQGFEALAQKMAVLRYEGLIERAGLSGRVDKILDMADEILLECDEEVADEVGVIVGESYKWAAEQIYNYHVKFPEHFPNKQPPKFPINLDGGYQIGKSYLEVH